MYLTSDDQESEICGLNRNQTPDL